MQGKNNIDPVPMLYILSTATKNIIYFMQILFLFTKNFTTQKIFSASNQNKRPIYGNLLRRGNFLSNFVIIFLFYRVSF